MLRPVSTCTLLIAGMFSVTPWICTSNIDSPLYATRARRWLIIPTSFTRRALSLMNSYSSGLICGLRLSISKNFFGSQGPNQAIRTTRKPSAPILDTLSAMYRFMPWMREVTAIRVVVARMIPSSVRKLRSLFLRSESSAMRVASQNEALKRNFGDVGNWLQLGRRGFLAICSLKQGRSGGCSINRMRKSLLAVLLLATALLPAQTADRWAPFQFLAGKWTADGGEFSFQPDLNG